MPLQQITNSSYIKTNPGYTNTNMGLQIIRDKITRLRTTFETKKRLEIERDLSCYLIKGNYPDNISSMAKKELKEYFIKELDLLRIKTSKEKIDLSLFDTYLESVIWDTEEVVWITFLFTNSYIQYTNILNGKENLIHQTPDEVMGSRVADCDDLSIFYSSILDNYCIENRVILMYWDKNIVRTDQAADVLVTFKTRENWGSVSFEDTNINTGLIKPENAIEQFISNGEALKARWVNKTRWLTVVKEEMIDEKEDNDPKLYFYKKR